MPFDVQIQDEDGNPEGPSWGHRRSTELLIRNCPDTACLRFIDPNGDTTFNQLQLPVLLQELRSLERSAPDAEARQVLSELITYVQKAQGQVHTYVKFIGD